ncbi:hypothetical protein BAE44_0010420, partial [Dichanthelium oligosanthes]
LPLFTMASALGRCPRAPRTAPSTFHPSPPTPSCGRSRRAATHSTPTVSMPGSAPPRPARSATPPSRSRTRRRCGAAAAAATTTQDRQHQQPPVLRHR